MSDEAVRQTRSQRRALERDSLSTEPNSKKVKLEEDAEPSGDDRSIRAMSEPLGRVSSIINDGEVKATIKVEVQTGEEPVDMSTSSKSEIKMEKRPPSPDDVIVLSDNDSPSPQMNGHVKELDTDLLMRSSPEERERVIKQLKEELRLEEAKLVLLKRLRQSQTQKESAVHKPTGTSGSGATPPPLVRGTITAGKGSQVLTSRSSGTVIPPPLVRGVQQVSKHGSQNSQIIMPPLVRGAQPISVSPQQLQSLRQQQQQHSSSGPPPLMLAPRASVPSIQGHKIIQPGLIRVASVGSTSLLVNIPQSSPTNLKSQTGQNLSDSPASRQAAAKLALRKQLEKTLLEIPPPKPPAPELNFLPSAANNEFIYLVGLEEVVQNLLDTLGKGKLSSSISAPKDPFTCTHCKTDFTCRWRKDKGGAIMCEQCMSSKQKKVLKAEHTNRLKAAFVKALQQEQDIEQRILQQSSSPISHSTSTSSSSSSSSSATSSSAHTTKVEQQVLVSQQMKQVRTSLQQPQHSRGNQAIARHHSTIKQTSGQLSRSVQSAVGVRSVPHSFTSTSQQLQNAMAAAALVGRPGKHAVRSSEKGSRGSNSSTTGGRSGNHGNASVWRKASSITSGVTMAYVNPSLSVHRTTSSAVERQREYLLDMIPSRSISQTANTWK